jgi:hypothetical protein
MSKDGGSSVIRTVIDFRCPFCSGPGAIVDGPDGIGVAHKDPICVPFGEMDTIDFARSVLRMRALAGSRKVARA